MNTYFRDKVCRDENFWRNRFVTKYGNMAAEYKPKERSWKEHYLQVLIDLDRFSKNPMKFLDNIVWDRDIQHSYYVSDGVLDTYIRGQLIPLMDAPEWVLNNLYLLNLGDEIKLASQANWENIPATILYDTTIFRNAKPIELLTFISDKYKLIAHQPVIRGFNLRVPDGYRPLKVTPTRRI